MCIYSITYIYISVWMTNYGSIGSIIFLTFWNKQDNQQGKEVWWVFRLSHRSNCIKNQVVELVGWYTPAPSEVSHTWTELDNSEAKHFSVCQNPGSKDPFFVSLGHLLPVFASSSLTGAARLKNHIFEFCLNEHFYSDHHHLQYHHHWLEFSCCCSQHVCYLNLLENDHYEDMEEREKAKKL